MNNNNNNNNFQGGITVREIYEEIDQDDTLRRRGQSHITSKTIQTAVINRSMEIMGHHFWSYGMEGTRCNYIAAVTKSAQKASGFAVSYKTVRAWIKHYQQFGEIPAETKSRGKVMTIKGIRASRVSRFTAADENILLGIIRDCPQLYLDEIQQRMADLTKKIWSTSTIWRHLHNRGYSLREAVFRASQQQQFNVDTFLATMLDKVTHPHQLVYVDETARGANASRRRRAWAPQGIQAIVNAPFTREHDKRYSLIAACDWNGFIIDACHVVERESGKTDNNPDRGTVDTDRFVEYIRDLLVPLLGRYEYDEPRSIVVMDNASIHCCDEIEDLIHESGALLIYTAPYSPEWNPIEYMFGVYKASLKRMSINYQDPNYDWFYVHYKSLLAVTPETSKNFFKKCEVPKMDVYFEEQKLIQMMQEEENNESDLPFPFSLLLE